MRKLSLFLLLIPLLAGCQTGYATEPLAASNLPTASETATASLTFTNTLGPSPTASMSPTPDARPEPEYWQDWPIVPEVTGTAIELYRYGQTLGNNPNAFSKVGDCQSVKASMMGYLDLPDRIPNTAEYAAMQETIDQFAGFFNTDGQAVKGGFNPAAVLSPLWANPESCLAGETPLECELRRTKPIIVFVSFEVWFEGRTPETYENYMSQIIEIIMAHGAIPILGTKADNVEGDHSINLATARLAHKYDLPLWNFWLAVQPLPNHGIDITRDDGFHIDPVQGWSVRSFTALESLDSIWRAVRDATALELGVPTATPTPMVMSGLLPTPSSGPSLASGGEKLVFGMAARSGEGYQPQGIYLFDLDSQKQTQLLGTGWDFQAASPEGQSLLVSFGSSLYRTDGITLSEITSDFYPYANQGALLLDDGSIVFIKNEGGGTVLARVASDGSGLTLLSQQGQAPIDLYASTDGTHVTWESGTCTSYRVCERQGAWLTNMESGEIKPLPGLLAPVVSPDGSRMAYEYSPEENKTDLAFATIDGVPTQQFPVYGDVVDAKVWQPGGGLLAVHMAVVHFARGEIIDGLTTLVNPVTFETRSLPPVVLLNPTILWSTDGDELAWLGTSLVGSDSQLLLFRVDAESGDADNQSGSLYLGQPGYIFVTNGAWLDIP